MADASLQKQRIPILPAQMIVLRLYVDLMKMLWFFISRRLKLFSA